LSKWPEASNCQHAAVALAEEIEHGSDQLHTLTEVEFANALNGLAKWPQQPECRSAAKRLIVHLTQTPLLMYGMGSHVRSVVLHSLGKWPDDATVLLSVTKLTQAFPVSLNGEGEMKLLDVIGSLNGLLKWPNVPHCRRLIFTLAAYLCVNHHLLDGLYARQLVNLLNGLSRWPDELTCRHVLAELTTSLIRDPALTEDMNAFELAITLNGLG
jgi:hypothetical protein